VRILLFTGKGGVGKSTVAAATATLAADAGHRTLVLSTDAAHSLADAFGVTVGHEPEQVGPGLFVHQVDAQRRFEQSWAEIQGYLLRVLEVAGVDPVAAEELTVIPGAEEVLALLELRLHALSEEWDTVVVDCAPTAETLRLLALPEALGWYMTRVFPVERRIVRALKPVLTRAAGVPMPEDDVFAAVERLHAELDEVRGLLIGADAGVRLVLTPEQVVLAEARRSYTTLSLFGYRVDGVIANRVFPTDTTDPWLAGWVSAQGAVLDEVEQSFAGVPIWRSQYRPSEPVGLEALRDLGRTLYDGADPVAVRRTSEPLRITRSSDGAVLHLRLPFVGRADVDLARDGDDLVVTVASYRRLLTLPSGLARQRVAGARVDEGELQVRFAGGPADRPTDGTGEE
jgi:arsenite/tail-anchored protein-transporting ATPase